MTELLSFFAGIWVTLLALRLGAGTIAARLAARLEDAGALPPPTDERRASEALGYGERRGTVEVRR